MFGEDEEEHVLAEGPPTPGDFGVEAVVELVVYFIEATLLDELTDLLPVTPVYPLLLHDSALLVAGVGALGFAAHVDAQPVLEQLQSVFE